MAMITALGPEKTIAQKLPAPATLASASAADAVAACNSAFDLSHPGPICRAPLPESLTEPLAEPLTEPLIVIGFMGGRVRGGNLLHKEALLVRDLDQRYPNAVYAVTFANRKEPAALHTVLQLLDTSQDGRLSAHEKSAARIVIFGHSWGASETVHFARVLGRLGIPVLLTIQVDSVEKSGEDDQDIPPNVREAINFYETDGLLHGRSSIQAMDPQRTEILGNYESTYKSNPVSCAGFSWYARAFMKPHIEIENDSAVWNRIEALIVARSRAANPVGIPTPGTQ